MFILLKSVKSAFCLIFVTLSVVEALLKKSERVSFLKSMDTENCISNDRFEDLISEILMGEALVNDFVVHYDSTSREFVDRIIKNTNAKKKIEIKPRNVITTENSSHSVVTVMLNYDKINESKETLVKISRRFTMHIISLKKPAMFDKYYVNHLKSSDILIFICQKHCGSCEGAFKNGASINALDPLFLKTSTFLKKVLLTIIIEVLDDRVRHYEICFYCGAAAGELIQKHELEIPTGNSFNNIGLYPKMIDTFKFNSWNFNSHIFKVGFRYKEMHFGCRNPIETVTSNRDESVVSCDAYFSLEGNILLEAQKRLNFKVELSTFRANRSDGTAEKLMTVTNENRVDWAIGGVTVTSSRTRMVHFSFPVSEDPAKIIYSSEGGFLKDGLKLVYVFSTFTWILIAVTLLAQSAVVYISNRISGERKKMFSDIIWVIGFMLTEQSVFRINWKSLGGRVLILWLLFCIHISTLFKAQLTSFITKPLSDPLSNFDQLVNGGFTLNLISAQTRFISEMLNSSSDKSLQELSHKVIPRIEMCPIFKDMIGKKQMVIDELDVMYRELNKKCRKILTNEELLNLRVTSDNIFPSTHAWAFPKKSPYYSFINDQIMLYHQNGLQKKWSESLIVSPGNLSVFFNGHAMIDQTNFSAQHMKFHGHFVLWIFGIGLSLLCFMAEIGYDVLRRRKEWF